MATEYHRRLAHWKTHAVLASPRADRAAIDRALARLSNEELATAGANPDHSEAARIAAADALHARGGSGAPPALIAPGFLSERFVDGVIPNGNHGGERWLGWFGALAFWVSVIAFFVVTEPLNRLQEDALVAAHQAGALSDADFAVRNVEVAVNSTTRGQAYMDRASLTPFVAAYKTQEQLGRVMLLSALGAGALWVFGRMLRSRPARVLLLRKFNNTEVDYRLRRFAKRYLSPLGHVYTLADKHFRRPIFDIWPLLLYISPTVWAPILALVPWDLVRGRLNGSSAGGRIRIWSARQFRQFAQRIAERVASNTQVMASRRGAIAVRTSDAWWQPVVKLLMLSADVIVVDLSDVASGTEWELDRLSELNLLDRTVFVVRKDAVQSWDILRERFDLWRRHGGLNPVVWKGLKSASAEARRAFERLGVREGDITPILFDARGRALDRGQLDQTLRAAIRAGVLAKRAPPG